MVKKRGINYLDFEVDKLTRSIENIVTGDSFETEIGNLLRNDLVQISKKKGWLFDWKYEFDQNDREVYKLTIRQNPNIIQGVISLRVESDHIYSPLIEVAPFNKGKGKIYLGIPGNLVAYACRLSFQKGYEGFVSFHAKTKLIDHYFKTLGATHAGGQLMFIHTDAALQLIEKYFKS